MSPTASGLEPSEISVDLRGDVALPARLSAAELGEVQAAIAALRTKASRAAAVAEVARGKSALDRDYEQLKREWGAVFVPPNGATSLGHLLDLPSDAQVAKRKRRVAADAFYALCRLVVATETQTACLPLVPDLTLAAVLALFRTEGNLHIPPSLEGIRLGLLPQPWKSDARPDWPITHAFMSDLGSFHLDRDPGAVPTASDSEVKDWQRFVKAIESVTTDREHLQRKIELEIKRPRPGSHTALQLLTFLKIVSFCFYELLLAGLDFYVPAAGPLDARWEKVFAYNFARYRKILGAKETFVELVAAGITAYRSVVVADLARFMSSDGGGKQALILTLSRRNRAFDRHVVPRSPIDNPAIIVGEGVIRLEACRRGALWLGGPKFADPLPYSLAYVRYSSWDVYFIVLLLDALDRALNGSSLKSFATKEEKGALQRVRDLLRSKKDETKDAWGVLDRWRTDEAFRTTFSGRMSIRDAILADAMAGPHDAPGSAESLFVADLLSPSKGGFGPALDLIGVLTSEHAWGDAKHVFTAYARYMVDANGTERPKLNRGYPNIQNALRFTYLHEGYSRAFADL